MDELRCFAAIAEGGAARAGAVAALYRTYERPFVRFLRPIDSTTAQDLVHDCFEKLLRAPLRLSGVRNPRAYLWSMLRNVAIDYHRSQAASPIVSQRLGTSNSDDEGLAGAAERLTNLDGSDYDWLDVIDAVERAYNVLAERDPDKARAIRLVAEDGLTGRELALALGRSEGAAREFLSQARKELQRSMSTGGASPEPITAPASRSDRVTPSGPRAKPERPSSPVIVYIAALSESSDTQSITSSAVASSAIANGAPCVRPRGLPSGMFPSEIASAI